MRLSADLPSMAPAQRRLARYLLDHAATASDLGITDLADEAGVSAGTISALCRRLGLRGYQDLRLGMAREAVSLSLPGAPSIGREVATGDAMGAAVERVFGAALEALGDTARQLDLDTLAAAVEHITAARRVEWVGVGSAGLVAAEGALKLRKLGIDSFVQFDGHQQAMSASLLGERDALIAVSHSGRTMDVLASVRVAREGGARIIAITGVAASPLAHAADLVLATVSYDTGFQVEPMASTIAELAMVQLLFLVILERGGDAAQARLARTQAALEDRHVRGRLR
jgi:DNA-binding MurR/RpiR family transcriptional regulator